MTVLQRERSLTLVARPTGFGQKRASLTGGYPVASFGYQPSASEAVLEPMTALSTPPQRVLCFMILKCLARPAPSARKTQLRCLTGTVNLFYLDKWAETRVEFLVILR